VHNPAYQKVQRELAKASHRGDTQRRGRYDESGAAYLPGMHVILATAGCVTCVTPMTPCSVSPDRRLKLRRSSAAWSVSTDELKLELNQEKTLITHARHPAGEVPRLRGHHPALRPLLDQWPSLGQWSHGLKVPRVVIKAKCPGTCFTASPCGAES